MVHTSTYHKSDSPSSLPDDELAALAQMTGYKPESSDEVKTTKLAADPDSNNSLLDDGDLDEAQDTQTKTHLWSNPFAKALFVAFIMALIFGSIGVFLMSINHRSPQEPDASKTPQSTTDPTPSPGNQDAEIGRLKTTAALGSQQQLLQQNAKGNGARILPQQQVKAQPSPTPVAVRPAPAAYSAASRSYSQPTRPMAPLPVQRSYSSPLATASTPPVQAVDPQQAWQIAQAVDPQQAWQIAQAVGSYGQVPSSASAEQPNQSNAFGPAALPVSRDQSRYSADAAAFFIGYSVSHCLNCARSDR